MRKLTLTEAADNPFLVEWATTIVKSKEPVETKEAAQTYLVITRTEYSHSLDDLFYQVHSMSDTETEGKQKFKESVRKFFLGGLDYDSACQLIKAELTPDEASTLKQLIKLDPHNNEELRKFMVDHFAGMDFDDIIYSANGGDTEEIYLACCESLGVDFYEDSLEAEEQLLDNHADMLNQQIDKFIETNYFK